MRRSPFIIGLGLAALLLGMLPAGQARAASQAVAANAGPAGAGTNIGNAAELTGTSSGSLPSSTADDWWVSYPATPGADVAVTVRNTTSASAKCNALTATLYGTNGTDDVLNGATLSGGQQQSLSSSSSHNNGSDRYFVEVTTASCAPGNGQAVTYTLTLNQGGGGTPPSPASGSIQAGTSIGGAWPPLQGHTSYTGTLPSSSADDWYVLYKKPDANPGTIRVEDTTDAGTTTCASLTATLYAADGTDDTVNGATLGDNSAQTFAVPGQVSTDTTGLYYLEIHSPACTEGGISYRVEPEPGAEWQNPAKLPSGTAPPGSSIGAAWPPLQGATTYQGTVTSGTDENWYVLYKKPGTSPASVRVEDTTVAGSTSCAGVTVTLDGADGSDDILGGATLGDNSAVTMPIPAPGGPDYLNRYYLEVTSGCASGGATYLVEPEPGGGWASPAKPPARRLPAGASEKASGGPLAGGVTYDAALANGTTADWVFFYATGKTPLTVSVQNTTSNLDNCLEEDVSLVDSGGIVNGATLGDDDGAEFVVDAARVYYLEISVAGDCPPDTPLTAAVTLTPSSGACTCGCKAGPKTGIQPAAAAPFAIEWHKPGGGTSSVANKPVTVGVGEPIDLSLACAPGGTAPTGPYRWKLPAKSGYPVTLSNYDIESDGSASKTTLEKLTSFTGPKFSFHFLRPGTYTVTAMASVNGSPKKAMTTFDVKAPQAEFAASTCEINLNTLWTYDLKKLRLFPQRLSLGLNDKCVKTAGITWSAKVTLKEPGLPAGDLAVVQVLKGVVQHSTQKKACLTTNGAWEADGSAFYPTGTFKPVVKGHTISGFASGPDMGYVKAGKSASLGSNDSPGVWLHNGGTWTADLRFTDYLMYRPNYQATDLGNFGIWVALRQLSWTFHASASFDAKSGKWTLGKVTDPNKKTVDSSANPAEPQFSSAAVPGPCP